MAFRPNWRPGRRLAAALASAAFAGFALHAAVAAAAPQRGRQPAQKIDAEYTAKIKEYTQDPRVITELVDHLPASDTIPSPLEFLGRVAGTPDELTYYKDMVRYFDELDRTSNRMTVFRIGKSEEGRDMIVAAIADEATIKALDKYKSITAQLTDPRRLTEEQARQLIATGKPIYWATGNLHSGETGSAEMQMELAFRLIVEETPFIQNIRNNVITLLTPVVEVDGREKVVDNLYYRKKTGRQMPLVYWGQYVAHDNNRDGLGVGLKLTQNILKTFLDWHPQVLHDLHESVPYLYVSTGAGPYNTEIDPVQVDEWWLLAKYEVAEMTKRGVPGVWTGGFYDGWTPNYLFWIANNHNSIGRFYETQSYGPQNQTLNTAATATSKEWYRPNPPLPQIKWGPRNNVNIQQSALLFALQFVAKNREMFLENYYLKNKRAIERGRSQAPNAWVIPASQRRRADAAALVNLLRLQGVEVHTANAAWSGSGVQVAPGDYVVRMDQPFSNLVDIFLGTQYFAPANPNPYDDTGWSLPLLRNVKAHSVDNTAILDQPMTLLTADAAVPGAINGSGSVLIVEHTGEMTIAPFRFANAKVKMLAAEEPFDAAGRRFVAGSIIIPNADRAALEPSIREHGLTAWAVASQPAVATHDLDVPRIGYVHSWSRTQDEGWVRMAFDKLKIPYTYFGDTKLREPNLRQKFDVIIFPHVGGTAQSQVAGVAMTGEPIPYKKTELTPNLGVQDSADDIRGGMGFEGLVNLMKFVEEGGLLITEGSTSLIFPGYNLLPGVTIEEPAGLFARGVVMKGIFADRRSPIAYGYDNDNLAVYFSSGPVINAGGAGFGGRGGGGIPGVGQNLTPNATPPTLTTLEGKPSGRGTGAQTGPGAPAGRGAGAGGGRGAAGGPAAGPRVILRFPTDPDDMLLSGGLVGQEALVGRALVVDSQVGKGHVVSFANRPYWRMQTYGSFNLGFNAILNWNDLNAGRGAATGPTN
ncbi:MAG: M14 family zinc carboxypeptidase [Vicinamibacterales bacterium]